MTRVASLGMYDLPILHDANDRLWAAIAGRLRASGVAGVPERLDRSRPVEAIWDDPDLLLAQTCGYPLMTRWRDRLAYVATPSYLAPGCDGTAHRSRIVVRRDSGLDSLGACAGHRAAINDPGSNSGMNLLRAAVAPLAAGKRFFSAIVVTGSHAASAIAVAQGQADIAAIDAVTFSHLDRAMPGVTGALATIGWSDTAPNLPFVSARTTPAAELRTIRRAIRDALHAEPDAAATLRMRSIQTIGVRRYDTVLTLANRAASRGYPHVH